MDFAVREKDGQKYILASPHRPSGKAIEKEIGSRIKYNQIKETIEARFND